MRTLTLYRDDSTAQVVYENVKHFFWTAGNTVLVIAQITDDHTGAHRYIHWPRERFCWFKDSGSCVTASETSNLELRHVHHRSYRIVNSDGDVIVDDINGHEFGVDLFHRIKIGKISVADARCEVMTHNNLTG